MLQFKEELENSQKSFGGTKPTSDLVFRMKYWSLRELLKTVTCHTLNLL